MPSLCNRKWSQIRLYQMRYVYLWQSVRKPEQNVKEDHWKDECTDDPAVFEADAEVYCYPCYPYGIVIFYYHGYCIFRRITNRFVISRSVMLNLSKEDIILTVAGLRFGHVSYIITTVAVFVQQYRGVAQLVARLLWEQDVGSSSLFTSTIFLLDLPDLSYK